MQTQCGCEGSREIDCSRVVGNRAMSGLSNESRKRGGAIDMSTGLRVDLVRPVVATNDRAESGVEISDAIQPSCRQPPHQA